MVVVSVVEVMKICYSRCDPLKISQPDNEIIIQES
jgi:hypothetical protein